MSNQGAATISREANIILEELYSMGFKQVTFAEVGQLISESDVIGNDDYDCWVESADSAPGELENYPHIVYCVQSHEPGSVVAKTYKPIS